MAGSASPPQAAPFSGALELTPERGGYRAELTSDWAVDARGTRQHGGLMTALVAKAGLAGLAAHVGADEPSDPLAVSAEFLRAPEVGSVRLDTEVLKVGRTASVVRVLMSQHDRPTLSATVTAGTLPDEPEDWTELPALDAEPPEDGLSTTGAPGPVPPLATACRVVLARESAWYLDGHSSEPVMLGWVRPVGEEPDALFSLLAGDILPPVLFNLGRRGWAPTVQLTALVRARPAPGWLRLRSAATSIAGGWLDEDLTVIDSAGRLICQARQLALVPLPRS